MTVFLQDVLLWMLYQSYNLLDRERVSRDITYLHRVITHVQVALFTLRTMCAVMFVTLVYY